MTRFEKCSRCSTYRRSIVLIRGGNDDESKAFAFVAGYDDIVRVLDDWRGRILHPPSQDHRHLAVLRRFAHQLNDAMVRRLNLERISVHKKTSTGKESARASTHHIVTVDAENFIAACDSWIFVGGAVGDDVPDSHLRSLLSSADNAEAEARRLPL